MATITTERVYTPPSSLTSDPVSDDEESIASLPLSRSSSTVGDDEEAIPPLLEPPSLAHRVRVALPQVAYKVAVLAPKLLCSGAGWAIGFILGGPLGAGIGDGIGTFLGCVVSLGMELLIGRYFGLDPSLRDKEISELVQERLKSAFVMATANLVGGYVFSLAFTYIGGLLAHDHFQGKDLVKGLFAGGGAALSFLGGSTLARIPFSVYATYRRQKEPEYINSEELSKENVKKDLAEAVWMVLPAQIAFTATSFPLFNTSWLRAGSSITPSTVLKSAGSVALGGITGCACQATAEHLWQKAKLKASLYVPDKNDQVKFEGIDLEGLDPYNLTDVYPYQKLPGDALQAL